MGPRPIKVCRKEGMNVHDRGKSEDKFGIPNLAAPLDRCSWPLAFTTVIVGAVRSKLIIGAFFEK